MVSILAVLLAAGCGDDAPEVAEQSAQPFVGPVEKVEPQIDKPASVTNRPTEPTIGDDVSASFDVGALDPLLRLGGVEREVGHRTGVVEVG